MSASPATPDFNLADGHGYMLGRSYAATTRLNLQYFLWKESLQFDIHPSIPITKGPVQIADVATGTAIWLTEVARQMPTASFYGFDISLAQTPPREWLPSNVTLVPWNIFDKVPEDMCGRFDVVHVRLLILVVQNSNPSNIIRSLVNMLKPGGYLQWDDLNYPETHVRTAGKLSKTSKSDELRTMVYSQGRHDWTLELNRFFSEAGLLDSKTYHYQDRPDLARANGEQHLLTMEEFASGLVATKREGEASTILQLIKDVSEEVLTGAVLSMPRVVCVGRKSESTIEVSRWYKKDIGLRLKPAARRLYEEWGGIAGAGLTTHLHQVRDRAWYHSPYPCVGQWTFLLPILSDFPQYPGILARVQAGASVLDIGCGFGQELRQLAYNGAPTQKMYASDLSQELWDLGFELFRDHEHMCATFVQADIFDLDSDLKHLSGQMDIIIANHFLHLFDWDQQLAAMKRIVDLSKIGTICVGYQRGQLHAQIIPRPWGHMFSHDLASFRRIWEKLEQDTGVHWELEADMVELTAWGMAEEDLEWMPPSPRGINFAATRRV